MELDPLEECLRIITTRAFTEESVAYVFDCLSQGVLVQQEVYNSLFKYFEKAHWVVKSRVLTTFTRIDKLAGDVLFLQGDRMPLTAYIVASGKIAICRLLVHQQPGISGQQLSHSVVRQVEVAHLFFVSRVDSDVFDPPWSPGIFVLLQHSPQTVWVPQD